MTDDIERDVEVSNAQKANYENVIKTVNTKKDQKEAYTGQTKLNTLSWGYPNQHKDQVIINSEGNETTVGEEMKKYGNDPIKFRNANKHLVGDLKEAWYLDDQATQWSQKVKPIESNDQSAGYVGSFQGVFDNNKKGYTEDQVNAIGSALRKENPVEFSKQVRELTQYLPENEKQKLELQAGVEAGILNKDGTVNPEFEKKVQEQTEAEIRANAPKDASPKGIDEAIAIAVQQKKMNIVNTAYDDKLFKTYWKNVHPDEDKSAFHPVSEGKKSGSGFNPYTDINWTPGQYNIDPADYLRKKYPGIPDDAIQTYLKSPDYAARAKGMSELLGRNYFAFNIKEGKENPPLVFDGKQINPTGFLLGTDGKPYLVGSAQFGNQSDLVTILALLSDTGMSEEDKSELKKRYGVQMIDMSNVGNQTEAANKLNFKSANEFKSYVDEKLGIKDYSQYKTTK